MIVTPNRIAKMEARSSINYEFKRLIKSRILFFVLYIITANIQANVKPKMVKIIVTSVSIGCGFPKRAVLPDKSARKSTKYNRIHSVSSFICSLIKSGVISSNLPGKDTKKTEVPKQNIYHFPILKFACLPKLSVGR